MRDYAEDITGFTRYLVRKAESAQALQLTDDTIRQIQQAGSIRARRTPTSLVMPSDCPGMRLLFPKPIKDLRR